MMAPTIPGARLGPCPRREPTPRHRAKWFGRTLLFRLVLGCSLLCPALAGGCAAAPRGEAMVNAGSGENPGAPHDGPRQVTRGELQQRLMAFADRYLSRISEATDYLKAKANGPAMRLSAHATKYYPATTVLTIAAAPDPEAGLLDMLTVVTLERMVWHDTGWAAEEFGPDGAAALLKAQVEAEQDIWACAAAVLAPERVRDVRQLIEDWRSANPGHRYVATMRFDDFAAGRGELSQRAVKLQRGGRGFLAPINEATRAVDETRLLGERFMFLTARLPRVMSWQAELFVYELGVMPEIKETLANNRAMTQAMHRFATSVEGFPAVITREREALLKDVAGQTGALDTLVKDARATLAQAQPVAADIRRTSESAAAVSTELRAVVREAVPLVDQIARLAGKPPLNAPIAATPAGTAVAAAPPTGGAPSVAAAPLDTAPARLAAGTASPATATPVPAPAPAPPGVTPPPGRPFDIQDYESAIRELRTLVDSTESLLGSRAWQARLNDVNNAADTSVARASREGRAMIDYSFYRGVYFAVFCAFLLFATALLYRFTARRLFPPHPHPTGSPAPAGAARDAQPPPEARPRHRIS